MAIGVIGSLPGLAADPSDLNWSSRSSREIWADGS